MSLIIVDSTTTGSGGSSLEVDWQDDGNSPSRTTWGRVNIWLATGSKDVQYKLQQLASGVSYNLDSAEYKIDPTVGPNGAYYFLRFEGTNTSTSTGIPAMAFSARFTLNQMTGTFNSTVMAQLSSPDSFGAAATTASASSAAAASNFFGFSPSTSTMSSMATQSVSKSSAGSSSSSASSSSSTSAKSSSGASSNKLNLATGFLGLAAAGLAFL